MNAAWETLGKRLRNHCRGFGVGAPAPENGLPKGGAFADGNQVGIAVMELFHPLRHCTSDGARPVGPIKSRKHTLLGEIGARVKALRRVIERLKSWPHDRVRLAVVRAQCLHARILRPMPASIYWLVRLCLSLKTLSQRNCPSL